MSTHPYDRSLWKAPRGTKRGLDRILEHVASCPKCRGRLARKRRQQEGDESPLPGRSLGVLARRQAALEHERNEAPSLFGSLIVLAPGQQLLLLKNSQRFRTWGLFELLIERGKEETFSDPRHAEQLLHLALRVADDLSPASYGRELIEDLRAETKNHRLWLEGNVAGSMGRRGEAETALQQAIDGFLSAGTPELAGLVAHDLAALRPHR